MSRKYNVQIGDKARDKVSGLVGTVTCRKEHLFGNIQFVIAPHNDSGDTINDPYAFDWQQLELVEEAVIDVTPHKITNDVELGDVVKDQITKVQGTVTSIWFWLNGCVEALIEYSDGEGGENGVRSSIDRFKVKEKARIKRDAPEVKEKVARATGGPSMRIPRESIK